MKTRFVKSGNLLALRIPSGLAKKVGACEGGQADMTVENGALIARVGGSKRRRRYSLEELVEQITDENIHHEIEWGPVGQRSK